jgi:hypothetical protein
VPYKYPCYRGGYLAWAREYPGKIRAKEGAREAYQYRPRAFELVIGPTGPIGPIGPIIVPRSRFTFK